MPGEGGGRGGEREDGVRRWWKVRGQESEGRADCEMGDTGGEDKGEHSGGRRHCTTLEA
jgi:hypothetical protein